MAIDQQYADVNEKKEWFMGKGTELIAYQY